ncbi:adenosylmethionine decarboxylase [Planotetraspora thailandica]|uniref:adenosylmethionine decarboxylase n=1 Tax=Planotetraspora thailandica TaxID=487172 RepID=UPI00194DDCB3|nr:adenosylmethionine decarboxylase [Planotetraspora thailandica]
MDYFVTEFTFTGTHVLCDITAVSHAYITDNALILEAIRRGIDESGATLCDMQSKEFTPAGMTAVYLLSESHVSVHTYPEFGSMFIDAFTCGTRCQPERIVETLIRALGPCEHRISIVGRGVPVRAGAPVGVPK